MRRPLISVTNCPYILKSSRSNRLWLKPDTQGVNQCQAHRVNAWSGDKLDHMAFVRTGYCLGVCRIYEQEKMPEEWRDMWRDIVPVFKEKGDTQECGNYRGIKLMSHTLKMWEKVIDRRLREESTMGEEQFGFVPGKGATDAIFAARQMIEKHRGRRNCTWCSSPWRRPMIKYHGRRYGDA